MVTKDLYMGIFLIFLSIFAYIETLSYPIDSAYFPRFVIILLAFLGLATLVKELLRYRKTRELRDETVSAEKEKIVFWKATAFRKVTLMIFSALVYMTIMNYVGFFATTLVYLPVMMRLLGIRKLTTIFLSSFLVVFFIYMIFVAFLNVPFPEGIAF